MEASKIISRRPFFKEVSKNYFKEASKLFHGGLPPLFFYLLGVARAR
jgi:hypothetical protein